MGYRLRIRSGAPTSGRDVGSSGALLDQAPAILHLDAAAGRLGCAGSVQPGPLDGVGEGLDPVSARRTFGPSVQMRFLPPPGFARIHIRYRPGIL
jgi:hypothetical protein